MRYANPVWGKFFFRRDLPSPGQYFKSQGLKLTGGGEWEKRPSALSTTTRSLVYVYASTLAASAAWSVVGAVAMCSPFIGSCMD